jgi:RDD family
MRSTWDPAIRTGSTKAQSNERHDVETARLGRGRGIVAVVINIVVVIVLLIVLGLLFGKTHTGDHSASVNLTGVSALIWFVLGLAYLIVPKVRTGQTIGRRLVGGRPSK